MPVTLVHHSEASASGGESPFDKAVRSIVGAEDVVLACPYLWPAYVESVLAGARSWRLLTDAEECLRALAQADREHFAGFLAANRHRCKHCPGLHGKVIASTNRALIGSANFTRKGLAGRDEMSVLFEHTAQVQEVRRWFDSLWEASVFLDEMEVERRVADLEEREPPASESPMLELSHSGRIVRARLGAELEVPVPAAFGTAREHNRVRGKILPTAIITVLVKESPKRPDTMGSKAFDLYRNGQTVADYCDAVANAGGINHRAMDCIRWDFGHGFISLNPTPQRAESQEGEEGGDEPEASAASADARSRLVGRMRQSPGREWIDSYLSLFEELIRDTGLTESDPRLVASIPKEKKLPVTLNQRYVLTGLWHGSSSIGLLLGQDTRVPPEVEPVVVRRSRPFVPHESETEESAPRLVVFAVPSASAIPAALKDEWKRRVRLELEHPQRKSSFRDAHHEPLVFRAAVDHALRRELLEEAFRSAS